MQFKVNNVQETLLFLSIFSAFAIYANPDMNVLMHLLTTVGFSIILFYIFTFISKKNKLISNTAISALILFLILHYFTQNQSIIYDLLVSFVAVFSKFFLEYKGTPIINPIVFSCIIIGYISQILPVEMPLFVSWWGTAFSGYLSLILILPWLIYGTYKWKKFPILISFLAANLIIVAGFMDEGYELSRFIYSTSTIYFLASVMLIEPKSSPFKNKEQIIYGLIAGISYPIFMKLNLPYFELLAIALANLYNFALKIIQVKAMQIMLAKKTKI